MVTRFADIKYCIEVGSLSGRSQDCGNTTFQICNLCSNGIIGRVLETGVKISICFQIK